MPGYSFTISQLYPNIVNDSLSYQWSFGNLTDEDGYSKLTTSTTAMLSLTALTNLISWRQMWQLLPVVDNFYQLPKSFTAFTSCRHPWVTYHLNLSYWTKLKKPNLPDRIDHSWTLNWCLSWITQERIKTQPLLDPLCLWRCFWLAKLIRFWHCHYGQEVKFVTGFQFLQFLVGALCGFVFQCF